MTTQRPNQQNQPNFTVVESAEDRSEEGEGVEITDEAHDQGSDKEPPR